MKIGTNLTLAFVIIGLTPITHEKDRQSLIQKSCDLLVKIEVAV